MRTRGELRDGRKHLEKLARESGLALEMVEPRTSPGIRRGSNWRFHQCGRREGSFLDQLEWAAKDAKLGAILESDRIRLFYDIEVRGKWKSWSKKK